MESIGLKIVTDFDVSEGDCFVFAGHTVRLDTAEHVDFDGDGTIDTVLNFISDQPNGGAHDNDEVGTVVSLENIIEADQINVSAGVFYGVYEPFSAAG
ncbi:MAG: hypothetical protein MK180_17025 [Rhodobacteraceae bacterium]|nr:hypothetical protein [Paracoccaceae bacterium]